MRRLLLGWMAVATAAQAAPDPPAAELLARVRANMTKALAGLPNYTCRETIARSIRPPRSKRFETADLFRLEVAYLEGREMFAWPGSPRFGEKNIQELVPGGAMATGNFGALAQAVFVSGVAVFTFEGSVPDDPQRLVRFAYHVPREKSSLVLNHEGTTAVVGYHGSFAADPDNYDVAWLEVATDDIPFKLEIGDGRERMEYTRARIGNSLYLLPKASTVMMVDLNGRVSQNQVTFDACREFTGESTITFSEPAALPETRSAPVKPQQIPAGVEFALRLSMPVERGVTAIGDTVSGELTRDARGPVAIPKGAAVTLRVTAIEELFAGRTLVHGVSFQVLRIEIGGRQYDVTAAYLRSANGPGSYATSKGGGVFFRGPSRPVAPGLEMT